MAFRFKKSTNQVWREIKLSEEETFQVLFKKPDYGQLVENQGGIEGAGYRDPVNTRTRLLLDQIKASVIDWKDILDEDGEPIPFNEKNLSQVLTDPEIFNQVHLHILKLYNVRSEDDLGNSEKSLGDSSKDSKSEATP